MYPRLFIGTPFETEAWDVCLLVGFIIVLILALVKKPKGFPLTRVGIFILFFLMLYFGFTGGKLLYLYLHWASLIYRYSTPLRAIAFSGTAFLGALTFELITIFVFTKFRIRRVSFLKVADYIAPFMMLHQAFVRVGCFLTGCCYGKPTTLPWGLKFRAEHVSRHPTQLYSMALLLSIFFVMRHLYKKALPPGATLFGCLLIYGFFRFFIEFLRVDSMPVLGVITLAQITMLGIAGISALVLASILKTKDESGKITTSTSGVGA